MTLIERTLFSYCSSGDQGAPGASGGGGEEAADPDQAGSPQDTEQVPETSRGEGALRPGLSSG